MTSSAFFNAADSAGGVRPLDGRRRVQGVPAVNGDPVVNSADLVARALAVLDQDKVGDDVRYREANTANEPATRPVASNQPLRSSSHCSGASSAMEHSALCPSAISTFNASSPPFWSRLIEHPSCR
jgi:hypothetical protein